ncbi:protein RKD1-like [Ipomoea triloba]|uniref:protein RKD1-like n=1 Tax=Ipomoea triloba TaxID=35885 RepID=UPI00125D4E32|nr:protein RKD1-like [Ipomoea triloba]
MANHVSSSSAFTNQLVYPSSDASEYPFWDAQREQFPLTYFNAKNNDEPLLNMDFDPFWNFEHNLERLIEATALNPLGMDEVLLPSASVIPIEWDITPTSNAVAVNQDTSTGTKESMIEKIVRRQSKRTKKTFRDPSTISKAMLSTYFHMPIYKAAKELRVEYRILKRRCEELGIFRWPHRQLISLQKLSENVKELGSIEDDPELREVLKEIKDRREMMLTNPHLKLHPAEIKLRDACTRKKRHREMMSFISPCTLPVPSFVVDHILPLTVDPHSREMEENESFQLLLDGFQ